ncbi:MAG: gluconate transporter [Planctomycetes bacterium RBG_16_64_12]|nr:MAG: gluconate transporter [Planctomycetes bacterium RBG_16_64_12]
MQPVLILLIAIAIVLGGILLVRLHAFLALVLAALVVAVLTPSEALEGYAQQQVAKGRPPWSDSAAEQFVASGAAERVAVAFGQTCGKIGILIAMASIIGKCLLDSGAADRIVRFALRLLGQARAPLAFVGSSFLLGVPIFFDTVFYLMIPLAKAMRLRTGRNYLLYVLSIVAGGSITHSLVPPTPGPLYVANELGVNLGAMIIGGSLIGLVPVAVGYFYARWANRRWDLPLRESADVSLTELEKLADRDERELPPVWLSLLPIVLPVVLIAGQTGVDTWLGSLEPARRPAWVACAKPLVDTLGDKNIALILGAAIALGTLAWQKRATRRELAAAVETALAGGGVIILITSAGGAFGATIEQCGVGNEIAKLTEGLDPVLILPVAFLVTALVRGAQGSATVAMITAVGVMGHFATSGLLSFHPVYLALAIGCGSKPFPWMNDSGFWVISKMSGMTEIEALRALTPMLTLMGIAGLAATMIAAMLLPLG